jgi:hypothetical protein
MRGFGMTMAALLAAASAAAQGRVFVTAQGVTVEAPPVAEMDCEQMQTVLLAIERSGYRVGAAPRDPADVSLRQYEDRLSRRHFAQCLQPRSLVADTPAIFGLGYEDEDAAQ